MTDRAKLLEALREIEEFTASAPDDDPLSHVHVVAKNALSTEQG